jgi:hypothetical protein
LSRTLRGVRDSNAERRVVADQVICRRYEHHRIAAMPSTYDLRGYADCRGGIAAGRFKNEADRLAAACASSGALNTIVLREKIGIAIRDDDDFHCARIVCGAREGLLQQTLAVDDPEQRFWTCLAVHGPQTCACTPADNHRDHGDVESGG